MRLRCMTLAAASAFLAACAATTPLSQPPLLLEGVSVCARPVTTGSTDAQAWFDQGLTLVYGFNFDEATRSFHAATEADPECTMAWWGLALASGVDLNDGYMSKEDCRRAHDAAQQALATSADKPVLEQALARAIAQRYPWPPPEDRTEVDAVYASCMEVLWRAWPDDLDVAALYAESLMALNPWDYYDDEGAPNGRTEDALAVLEGVLDQNPDHAGACHFLIHLLEVDDPARAEAAADHLAEAVPGSGHLLHMPSHIYVHVGRYDAATDANQAAIAADGAYFEDRADPGNYMGYYAHNVHMLAFAAMMEGREQVALDAARQLNRDVPDEIIAEMPGWLDGLMASTLHVLIRFGRWEDILAEPEPAGFRYFSRAQWHYARGVAYAATGRTEEAREELEGFEDLAAEVPEHWMAGANPSGEVLQLARHMLNGEILWREGEVEAAFEHLQKGVEIEDAMKYGEPPGWMQPVRHAYGALLMAADRSAEAEEVYRTDLEKNPGNGWSLLGLQLALEDQGRAAEAEQAAEALAKAWARADVEPGSSCFCEPGVARG